MGNEVSIAAQSSSAIPMGWIEDPDSERLSSSSEGKTNDVDIQDGDGDTGPEHNQVDYVTPEIRVTQSTRPTQNQSQEEQSQSLYIPNVQDSNSDSDYDGAELVSFLFSEEHDNGKNADEENEVENEEGAELEVPASESEGEKQSKWAEEVEAEDSLAPEEMEVGHWDESDGYPYLRRKKYGIKFHNPKDLQTAKLVGEGGFGRVLKGFLHNTPVAVKLFHSPIDLTKIQKELEILMNLKHRCIVGIFGVMEQTEGLDCPQVILQFYPEGNVLEYLSWKENPEDNGTLGKFAFDVIEGLQYLHRKGIVHGNLAARNVLVEKLIARNKIYYNAKVSDMGIIRFAEPTGGNYMKLPGSGKIVPIRWVPREIVGDDEEGLVGSDFTYESDIWSLGVVFWEFWTRGATPYGPSYSNLRVLQFIREGYSPLKVHRPSECPPQVVTVMENIFKVDPLERLTISELQEKFRCYKGYGKDIRPNKKKLAAAAAAEKKEMEKQTPTSPKLYTTEKGEKKKRKKKGNKSLPGPNDIDIPGPSTIPSRVVYNNAYAGQYETEEHLEQHSTVTRSRSNDDDPTIQALLARVNQLESERMGRGIRGGAGGGVLNQEHWKRRLGPPRYQRNYQNNHYNDYGDSSGNGFVERMPPQPQPSSSSPPSLPPPVAQPPPPYTESPLPNHSSTMYPIPGPSHEYRGDRGYTRPPRSRGGRPPVTEPERIPRDVGLPHSSVHGGEDFVRKIRRLAEEIEVLRAEKMTQELLKKSAELADLMKYMSESGTTLTGGHTRSVPRDDYGDNRRENTLYHHQSYQHPSSSRGHPSNSVPRESYNSYENYYGHNGYSPNPRWEMRRDRDHDRDQDNDDYYGGYQPRGGPRRGNQPRGNGKRGRGGKFSGYGGCGPYSGSNYYDHNGHGPYGGQT